MSEMWKSAEAHERMRDWHRRFRDKISVPLESRRVETEHGETHVLVGGREDAPPVIVLHGALASSAHVLLELEALFSEHRVYGVDILGQSAMSADIRLRVDDDSAGRWLVEVLDRLELPRVAVVGVSWGGFVAQRLAAVAPDRLTSLVLLVPAGVVAGPWWKGFVEMGWPLTRYLFSPSERNRSALLRALLTTVDDPMWAPYISDAFLAANMRTMRLPKLSCPGEFVDLRCPVHVIAADKDVSFPGTLVLDRARELFPTLETALLLEGTHHSPPTTPEFRTSFGARVSSLTAVS